jgi:hypothetical protein
MALYHVTVTGRSRPQLAEIGRKLRVIVVGVREDEHGLVVDAYVPENKIPWLRRQGVTV